MGLRLIQEHEMDDMLRPLYRKAIERVGHATFIQSAANAPELLKWYYKDFYEKIFYNGRVEVRLKELVRLKLSKIHGCAYWNRSNTVSAKQQGITDQELEGLDEYESYPFSPREKAALRLAERLSLCSTLGVDEKLMSDLQKNFSDAEIIELAIAVAILVGMAKMLFAFNFVEKENYCPL